MCLKRIIRKLALRVIRLIRHRSAIVEDHVEISPSVRVFGKVEIGRYTYIGSRVQIDQHVTKIGRYCSIASGCNLGPGPHPSHFFSTSSVFYEPAHGLVRELLFDEYEGNQETLIGHDVWIGTNAIVMAGISVGNGAIIGAGAIVTKDVPAYAIVVGVPARIVKYRFEKEIMDLLESSYWWELPAERIAFLASQNIGVQKQAEAFKAALCE
jgi:acetyltransferase-like isoleucine patch superfamily enzyme